MFNFTAQINLLVHLSPNSFKQFFTRIFITGLGQCNQAFKDGLSLKQKHLYKLCLCRFCLL